VHEAGHSSVGIERKPRAGTRRGATKGLGGQALVSLVNGAPSVLFLGGRAAYKNYEDWLGDRTLLWRTAGLQFLQVWFKHVACRPSVPPRGPLDQ
jgi:hypothetical protein